MAPKGLSHSQKLEKILDYFHHSGTCHTMKDLESALPSAAGVHKMQVKDLIKELTDESKVNVEKIGSGNWYWCWAGEEARDKKNLNRQLESEKNKLEASNATLLNQIERLREDQLEAQADSAHQDYLKQLCPLELEVKALMTEKDDWENAVAGGIEALQVDSEKLKLETAEIVDKIYTIEAHIQRLAGGDHELMENLRKACYGALYVEEEGGLPEIAGL